MAAQAGYLAIVQIGSGSPVTVTGIKSADVKIGNSVYDITAFSDGIWTKNIGGLANYTLTFAGNLDLSDAEQIALQAASITNPGATISWTILPQGVGAGLPKYNGTSVSGGQDLKFAVNAVNSVTFNLTGSGPFVYATQP